MKLEKYVYASGASPLVVTKVLQQFVNTYQDTEAVQGLTLYATHSNAYVVCVGEQMDIERFKYLVNFMNYPTDIECALEVKGFWTVGQEDAIGKQHLNQRVMFYISPKDTEYDNVFGVFNGGNKTIKFGFASGDAYQVLEKKELDYSEPKLSANDFELLETFQSEPTRQNTSKKGCLLFPAFIAVLVVLLLLF